MAGYQCKICGKFVYDEDKGYSSGELDAGTLWKDIPGDWRCPECGGAKDSFMELSEQEFDDALNNYHEDLEERSISKREGMSLGEVRHRSQDRLRGICSVNKVCDGDPKRVCMGQKYGEPIGFGGTGKGLGFTANIEALDRVKLKTRLISEHHEPDLSTDIFGVNISMPIMASSLSGVKASMGGSIKEEEFAFAVLQGCKDAGTIGWIGNTAEDGKEMAGVDTVKKIGFGIPIFKPQQNDKLNLLIKMAEDAGAAAVGIDLDGTGSTNWERAGKSVFRKSVNDLTELVDSTSLPFIAKGIMCVEDALDARDAGVKAIDVSNHGGRALDSTRGVADVLPGIAETVGAGITVTAGGGVRTGFDVLKMLALGASGVLIGRDIIRAALGGGPNGVITHLKYLVSDLRRGMILTSCNSIDDIDDKIIDI